MKSCRVWEGARKRIQFSGHIHFKYILLLRVSPDIWIWSYFKVVSGTDSELWHIHGMWALLSKTPYVWNLKRWKQNTTKKWHEFQLLYVVIVSWVYVADIVFMSGFRLIDMFKLFELGTNNPF